MTNDDFAKRSARVGGWIPLGGPGGPAGSLPRIGGLTDISRSGARLYLTWAVKPGDRFRLNVTDPDEPARVRGFLPVRVVWVRGDAPGDVEALASRLKILEALVRLRQPVRGMPFGFVVGSRFEPGTDPQLVRRIERLFEAEGGRSGKRVFASLHLPASPAPLPFRPQAT